MSQRDIDETLAKLAGAMITTDEQAALENALALLSGFLHDVKRIADSLKVIADKAGNPSQVAGPSGGTQA